MSLALGRASMLPLSSETVDSIPSSLYMAVPYSLSFLRPMCCDEDTCFKPTCTIPRRLGRIRGQSCNSYIKKLIFLKRT